MSDAWGEYEDRIRKLDPVKWMTGDCERCGKYRIRYDVRGAKLCAKCYGDEQRGRCRHCGGEI